MQSGWITIDDAAAQLGLERSGVFRMAKRGDFGPIQHIGGTQRPSVILVKASGVTSVAVARRKAHRDTDRALADELAADLSLLNPKAPALARYREARQR